MPRGLDVVHVFTGRDLVGTNGQVECVGGIDAARHAFGASEDKWGRNPNVVRGGPASGVAWGDMSARVLAHELGHQLAATHENATCTEGDFVAAPPAPCTIMSDKIALARRFSSSNAALRAPSRVRYAA